MPADFYDLLEVDRDADTSAIKRAYREKARTYHPDVNDDPRARDQFATLNRARETLTDPKERSRYDRLGHEDYVRQHLDGLPTMSRPSDADAGDGTHDDAVADDGTDGVADDGTDDDEERRRTTREAGGRADAGGSTAASSTGGSSTAEPSADAASRSAASGERASRTASGASSRTAPGGSGTSDTGTTDAASARTTTSGGATTGRAQRSAADRSAATSRKRGLRRGWAVSAAALVVYAVGLAGVAATAPDATSAALDALLTDPAGALAGASPLPDPANAVGAAAGLAGGAVTPPALAGAALGVGLVALPVAVGGTVARFGSGAATLYAVGTAVPAGWALMRPFVPAPLAADLLALAAAPLVAGVWFLADIGRYLRS